MSILKLTLPDTEIPVSGKMISFLAPCNCDAVDSVSIGGNTYQLVDPLGQRPSSAWVKGAMISIVLDCNSAKAYVQSPTRELKVDESGVLYI